MAGRKSKLTPDLQEKAVSFVKAGNYPGHAAVLCGIGERTFWRWMALGQAVEEERIKAEEDGAPKPKEGKADRRYWQFWQAIEAAKAFAAAQYMRVVQEEAQGGKDKARAAQWWLERVFPAMYGRQRIELTGADGGPVKGEATVVILPAEDKEPE